MRFLSRPINVFHNNLYVEDGFRFNSKVEYTRYKLLKANKEVESLKVHPRFLLISRSLYFPRSSFYKSDFLYLYRSRWWVEEIKGRLTNIYTFKKILFMSQRSPDVGNPCDKYPLLKFTVVDKRILHLPSDAEVFWFRVIMV
jgi:hypothetical protein